jgi:hypothetical protein
MANFDDISSELTLLTAAIKARLAKRDAVDDITVPQPEGTKDELYFRKLVSWSYVALVEAFPIPFRQITNLLRSSDNVSFKRISDTKELIQALRTLQSHNMDKKSNSNERQKSIAQAWLLVKGGASFSWEMCCTALCIQILDIFSTLHWAWEQTVNSDEDKDNFIKNLEAAIDGDWPAHSFDASLEIITETLGLQGIDIVAYRKTRFDIWKKLAGLFPDRNTAIQAVERAIAIELQTTFGFPEKPLLPNKI